MKLGELKTALSFLSNDAYVCLGEHRDGGVTPLLQDVEIMYYAKEGGTICVLHTPLAPRRTTVSEPETFTFRLICNVCMAIFRSRYSANDRCPRCGKTDSRELPKEE